MSALFYGGEHGVAGDGPLSVSKSTDADVGGNLISKPFHGIHDADGSIVVYGKESIRMVAFLHYLRSDYLSIGTVVAESCQRLFDR